MSSNLQRRSILWWLETRLICLLAQCSTTSFLKWWSRRLYPSFTNHRIFRLSKHTTLKAGYGVRPAEVAAMRYVDSHTRIPVPRVLKSWPLANDNAAIIMEWFNDAHTLEQRWKSIPIDEKLKIARHIRSFVDELRTLPQQGAMRGMICSPDGSACWDERLKSQRCGPFVDERAFNNFRLSLLDRFLWEPGAREQIDNIRMRLRDNHRVVFTHGDLGVRNVLVDDRNNIVALIDWEMAGWMPEYWEYIKTVHGRWEDEEWVALAREIAPPYDEEMEVDDQYLIVNGSPF